MTAKSLQQRYDQFCIDAEELLQNSGYTGDNSNLLLTGNALLQTLNTLASILLPEDREVGGIGPRGLIWDMYSVFEAKNKNEIEGSLALAKVVRYIIKYRPPIHLEKEKIRTIRK